MSTNHTSMCETSDVKQCTQKQAGEHRIRNRGLETGATGAVKPGELYMHEDKGQVAIWAQGSTG